MKVSDNTKLTFLQGSNWLGLTPWAFRRDPWGLPVRHSPCQSPVFPRSEAQVREWPFDHWAGTDLSILLPSLLPVLSVPVCPSRSVLTSTCYNKPKSKSLGLAYVSLRPPFTHLSAYPSHLLPSNALAPGTQIPHSSPDTSYTYILSSLGTCCFFCLEYHMSSSGPGEFLCLLQAPTQKPLTPPEGSILGLSNGP